MRLESLESRRLLTTVGVDGVDGDDLPLADAYMVSRGDFSVPVTPIHSGTDIATFYDYDTTHSYSSNTGYEASDRITLLLHEDPSADLGLVVLIDHVTDGSGGYATILFDGMESADLAVLDDPNSPHDSWNPDNGMLGCTWLDNATDGIAFSNLGDDFFITIQPDLLQGISGFDVITGDNGFRVSLPAGDEVITLHVEHALSVSISPESIGEADGLAAATGTVARSGGLAEDLLVTLANSNQAAVSVPVNVLIPAGQISAAFNIDAIDNLVPFDSQSIVIAASSQSSASAEASLEVINDDSPILLGHITVAFYDDTGEPLPMGYAPVGTTVVQEMAVNNTGNLAVQNVVVLDNNGTPNDPNDDISAPAVLVDGHVVGDTNQDGQLDPGESWQFRTSRVATAGSHTIGFSTTALEPLTDVVVSDSVLGTYFGASPAVSLSQLIVGSGQDAEGGVLAAAGDPIQVFYSVQNQGNVALDSVVVSAGDYYAGDTNQDGLLDTNEVWEFVSNHTAVTGPQQIAASISAVEPVTGGVANDSVLGTYFGASPAVSLSQLIVGSGQDAEGGVLAAAGDPVPVFYSVQNQGNVALDSVVVSAGDYYAGDTNQDGLLDTNEVWEFVSNHTAVTGPQQIAASISAVEPVTGAVVSDSVLGTYFGTSPAVSLSQLIVGSGQDAEGGVLAATGDPIQVFYSVQNQGNVALDSVVVSAGDYYAGDTNQDGLLDTNEVWEFVSNHTAVTGPQQIAASISAVEPVTGAVVSDSVLGTYFGASPAVSLSQLIVGSGQDAEGGVLAAAGDPIQVFYSVQNQGNVALDSVVVSAGDYYAGDTNQDGLLDTNEVWEFVSNHTAVAGPQQIAASISAVEPVTGAVVSDSVLGTYFGASPAVSLSQLIVGSGQDAEGGVLAAAGDPIQVFYSVQNQGNVALDSVVVSAGDYYAGDTNQDGLLDTNEVWEFVSNHTAVAGPQQIAASISAVEPVTGAVVSDSVLGTYFGTSPAVSLSQLIVGSGQDAEGGVLAATGDPIQVFYSVQNQGNVALDSVVVSAGDYYAGDTNQDGLLDTNEVWEFVSNHTAVTGPQQIAASISAVEPVTGAVVSDTVLGTYFGASPNVALVGSSPGYDLDEEGRLLVASGAAVMTQYQVSNPGNVALSGVQVLSGNVVAAAVLNGNVNVGDTNQDGLLDTNEVWEFVSNHIHTMGSDIVASVTAADSALGLPVSDATSVAYFGVATNLEVEAYLIGADGYPLEDPIVTVGDEVHFLYRVINTGNRFLKDLEVAGAGPVLNGPCNVGDLDCDSLLDPGEVWKYESSDTVSPGEHVDSVVVAASAVTIPEVVQATGEIYYFGQYRDLIVTQSGDSGIGSLRYVMEDARSRPDGGNITFAIPETDPSFTPLPYPSAPYPGYFVIQPQSALPALDGAVGIWIDGLQGNQESDAGVLAPQIILDGSLAGDANGLEIISDNNGIVGLGIQNFQGHGIHILGSGNTVTQNYIGVDVLGSDAGNKGDGIWIEAGSENMIGGFEEDPQNVIAYNGGNGVSVESGTGNVIAANEFFQNFAMAIDLGKDGLTINDVDPGLIDMDSGANEQQNTPVITRIEIIGDIVEVDYSVPTTAQAVQESLRVEFFLADASRREGKEFLGTDEYTYEDFLQGGKTLQGTIGELSTRILPVVATTISAQGNTSEFSAPRGITFVGREADSRQQEVADDVTGGIHNYLEKWLKDPSQLPESNLPLPTESVVVQDPVIDKICVGRGVFSGDASVCAIDVGGSDNPLVAIGFGEAVDEVTLAVNDYCSEKILDLADSLELVSGQIIACIWFDPINFSVSIGGNEVSYDYDNNPSAIVGSIPGASLVVTPAGQSTPGGVQVIMFAGNPASINVQMTTTNSGELMRGGVNIYTVSAGSNGPTVQPTIRTAFQGYLQRDTIVMSFDPSQPSFVRAGVAAGSVSVASLPAAARAVGGGAGGGLPIGIAGNFASPDLFAFAFLSPTALADSALDISGSTAVSEDQEGEVDGMVEMLEQLGGDDLDARDEDEEDVSGEDRDGLDAGEFEEEEDLPDDEEELDEAISVLFNLIGESLASDSGHVDVLKILEDDRNEPQQTEESAASPRHQPWETEATEFLAKSMDRLNPESSARVEPTGQSRFFGT